ncbi:MAG: hypothetical protein KY458_15540 [Actinobacteria bacterium]|nr:hypothetical protein [Actinomycetota bacterium]
MRFATHFGFRPDFCEAAEPESKGIVEAVCGYAQRDLVVPAEAWVNESEANDACRAWCAEVKGRVHSETTAVPGERLVEERALFPPLPSLRPPLRRGVFSPAYLLARKSTFLVSLQTHRRLDQMVGQVLAVGR